MPVTKSPYTPSGNFEQIPAGHHVLTVVDIKDPTISQWTGKEQYEIRLQNDAGVEIRTWLANSWWGGEPQPSKLFLYFKAFGWKSEESPTAEDINKTISKKVGVELVEKAGKSVDKEGKKVMFTRIKTFMSPKIALAYAEKQFEEEADKSVE